jgi:hypothetical protein
MAHRDMSEVTRIAYVRSEVTVSPIVYEAASRFFAAYIANEKVTNENEAVMFEKSIKQALELAISTENMLSVPDNQSVI